MTRRKHAPEREAPAGRWQGREKPDWLSRALARAGALPLPQAEEAIREGRVRVDGRTVRHPLAPVAPSSRVQLDGRVIPLVAATHVLAFHKPAGLLTSAARQHGVGTVFEALLPQLPPGLASFTWHAVGRLDRDTTGLLLFTNDERLVEHVTSPRSRLAKRYVAQVQGTPDEARLEPLRRGVQLEDGAARPARVRMQDAHTLVVEVTEGRNHQVKRMLGAVGLPVRALHREAVGGVVLDVPEGTFRELSPDEVAAGLGYPPAPGGRGLSASAGRPP